MNYLALRAKDCGVDMEHKGSNGSVYRIFMIRASAKFHLMPTIFLGSSNLCTLSFRRQSHG